MKRALLATLTALVASATNVLAASPLKGDEQVQFADAIARTRADGRVLVTIEAWVHELESRPGLSAAFARWLELDPNELSVDERALFNARTQLFRVDSERRKVIDVRFGDGREVSLPPTGIDGRSRVEADVDAALIGADDRVRFEMVMPAGDTRRFTGRALHVPMHGLSVVSDIDDTIKHSDVRNRRELLLNTFARPFVAAPGMASRFHALATDPTVRFHYVSSSPLQLQAPIVEFIATAGFPRGSVHLRETTSLPRVLFGGADSQRHKRRAIDRLLADFPQRRFVLVGDSGEHDPEIYAELARRHPGQIVAIGIRNVSAEPRNAPRYERTFAGLDPSRWDVFDDPATWQPPLPTP